jgi:hypothetical protein
MPLTAKERFEKFCRSWIDHKSRCVETSKVDGIALSDKSKHILKGRRSAHAGEVEGIILFLSCMSARRRKKHERRLANKLENLS